MYSFGLYKTADELVGKTQSGEVTHALPQEETGGAILVVKILVRITTPYSIALWSHCAEFAFRLKGQRA